MSMNIPQVSHHLQMSMNIPQVRHRLQISTERQLRNVHTQVVTNTLYLQEVPIVVLFIQTDA